MARKAASGTGTIRKKTVTRNGKEYAYWEARYSAGTDPGTGKQIQRSITGKTQKEVAQKLKTATHSIDTGMYTAPSKMTVGDWVDIWLKDYLGGVKPTTAAVYRRNIVLHIKPALGRVALSELHPHTVQCLINELALSPASVQLVHKILYSVLQKALDLGYINRNPAAGCELPKGERKEIHPLDDAQVAALMGAVKGGRIELLITVALFTGLRQSELLGLTWDCIDFAKSTVLVSKQLTRPEHRRTCGMFISPKNGKSRTFVPAQSVMKALRTQKTRQAEMQLRVGPLWDNVHNFVFTDDTGGPLEQRRVEKDFKAAIKSVGIDGARFHDVPAKIGLNQNRPYSKGR